MQISKAKSIIEGVKKGVVKEALPLATLCILEENQSLNGNQIRLSIGQTTGVFLSPAFFYSTLKALEVAGFVKSQQEFRSRHFQITEEGLCLLEKSEDLCKVLNLLIARLLP